MSNRKPEAHGGPVPERKQIPAPHLRTSDKRARSVKSEMNRPLRFVLVVTAAELLMIICLILWALLTPRLATPDYKLEFYQMEGIADALAMVAVDIDKAGGDDVEARGREFYEAALKQGVLGPHVAYKLVSLRSKTDLPSDQDWIAEPDGELPEEACSYTAPRANLLLELWGRTGDERCVLICFNARNWDNYGDRGVIVLWSDGNLGEFLTFEQASEDWGITRQEWDNPAEKLFGRKAPFQHTYE